MADPISMATMGVTAAGGILGAFGAAQKDEATAAMYTYKAGVAQANQQIAAQNAGYELQRGAVQEEFAGLRGAQTMGQMRVAQAESGLDIHGGSAALTRASQTAGTQTEEAQIMNEAQRRAYGYQVEGMNMAAAAQLDTMSAKATQAQEPFDVAGSLLGAASSVGSKWMAYSRSGSLGGGGGTPVVG